MSFHSSSDTINDEIGTPIVKNTFLHVPTECTPKKKRHSVPFSLRLCRQGLVLPSLDEHTNSDVSTAESSTPSECGDTTEMSFGRQASKDSNAQPLFDDCYVHNSTSRSSSKEAPSAPEAWPDEACVQNFRFVPRSRLKETTPFPMTPSYSQQTMRSPKSAFALATGTTACLDRSQRLRSEADAFQPQAPIEKQAKQHYKHRFLEVINWAKKEIQDSQLAATVQVADDANGLSLIIRPKAAAEMGSQEEHLIGIAKDALLRAASKSKCIYLLGYCSSKPFILRPQGFEASLGAMENATSACWHVFKKGFCRHGANCSKQHPACQMPVHVLVESAQLNFSPDVVRIFQREMAELAMAVTASLGGCAFADKVEAFDKGYLGWTIEVVPTAGPVEELKHQKDCLVTRAQNSLLSATSSSNTACIMGCSVKPFTTKSQGFITMIGDMQDETRACWDLYSKGICPKGCECRWDHPTCLMPINVVIKDRSSLRCSPAVIDHLAGDGLQLPIARRRKGS